MKFVALLNSLIWRKMEKKKKKAEQDTVIPDCCADPGNDNNSPVQTLKWL